MGIDEIWWEKPCHINTMSFPSTLPHYKHIGSILRSRPIGSLNFGGYFAFHVFLMCGLYVTKLMQRKMWRGLQVSVGLFNLLFRCACHLLAIIGFGNAHLKFGYVPICYRSS